MAIIKSKHQFVLLFSLLAPAACAGSYYDEDTGELVSTTSEDQLAQEEQALVARENGVRFNSCDNHIQHNNEGLRLVELDLKRSLNITASNQTFRRSDGSIPRINVITNFTGHTPLGIQRCRVIFGAGGLGNLGRIGQTVRIFLPKSFTDTKMFVGFRVQHFESGRQNILLRGSLAFDELGQKFVGGAQSFAPFLRVTPTRFETPVIAYRETCNSDQQCRQVVEQRREEAAERARRRAQRLCDQNFPRANFFGTLVSRDELSFNRIAFEVETSDASSVTLIGAESNSDITGEYAPGKFACAVVRGTFIRQMTILE